MKDVLILVDLELPVQDRKFVVMMEDAMNLNFAKMILIALNSVVVSVEIAKSYVSKIATVPVHASV